MNEKAVRRVWAKIPKVECKGLCQECCGPIMLSRAEEKMIRDAGHTPPTFDDEATCTALSPAGRCTIYEVRPFICRLYGASRNMVCPHGCKPSRWVPNEEAARMQDALGPLRAGDREMMEYLKAGWPKLGGDALNA